MSPMNATAGVIDEVRQGVAATVVSTMAMTCSAVGKVGLYRDCGTLAGRGDLAEDLVERARCPLWLVTRGTARTPRRNLRRRA